MEEIKAIIARNITALRQAAGMTQLELAEQLNYTDKAVSKWERGESLPDITTLIKIAEHYGVTLDYLVSAEHSEEKKSAEDSVVHHRHNRAFITAMSILLVWFIATLIFVSIQLSVPKATMHWLAYAYAIPASMIVWLVLNSIWFNRRRNYLIISLLVWSLLAAIHLTVLPFTNIWPLYLLGIPGQLIILLWSKVKIK